MQSLTFFLLGRKSKIDYLLAVLFLLSIAMLILNVRSDHSYGDYAAIYGSSRAAVSGMDPYNIADMKTEMAAGGANMEMYSQTYYWLGHVPVYPPLSYYILSPLSWLAYAVSSNIWVVLLGLSLVAGCAVTIHLSPLETKRFVLVGVGAFLATSSFLLRMGQPSALAIGLLAAASALCVCRRHLWMAAFLFFIAAAVKPQLALPLMVYFCFSRPTRKFALYSLGALVVSSVLSCLLLALSPRGARWPSELIGMLHSPEISGVPTGKFETGIINPQALTVFFSSDPKIYGLLSMLIASAIVLLLVIGLSKLADTPERDWLAVAGVSIVTLVLTYHRTYDMRMAILTLPALGLVRRAAPKIGTLLALLSCLMVVSRADSLVEMLVPRVGYAVSHGFLFRFIVERQLALFVLALSVTWVVAIYRANDYGFPIEVGAQPREPEAFAST